MDKVYEFYTGKPYINRDTLSTHMRDRTPPLEKELKYFLTKRDYDKLLRASRKEVLTTLKQLNVYFDDNALRLRKKRIGLRVRIENQDKCTLTLKEPSKIRSKKVPKLKVRHEWESALPLSLAKQVIKGRAPIGSLKKKPILVLKHHFSDSQIKKIMPLGSLKTVRTLVPADHGILLEIDKFKMFGRKFYELEVETHDPVLADQTVRSLLRKLKISCRPITKSKLGRFLDIWKKERRR
ncbi:MAG: CYTH domain-containing protein [Proteobacteria bacterium]|nr:CYTH domain-containing protein [Pseudomonadota bacterium]NDG28185.1 CYTH domain-containing protein [Pseudomonadota bacterium]